MQKMTFNTFSDVQWTISPPSLKSFIKDFQNVAKTKSDDEKLVNFIVSWEFLRKFPIGKEKTQGKNVVALTKRDIIPVETILENEGKIETPSAQRDGKDKSNKVSLAQLLSTKFDDDTLLQTAAEDFYYGGDQNMFGSSMNPLSLSQQWSPVQMPTMESMNMIQQPQFDMSQFPMYN